MMLGIRRYNRILFLLFLDSVMCDGQFECGDHGRFEYCIDEIPGCVIGCHCHPGYYFDTDTKICEPNVKLTQNYRRHYNLEPTKAADQYVTFGVTEPTHISRMEPIDTQVDEITKNADDLGDWLYNQFFKTIENQVINNTKETNIPSRRSGGESIKNMNIKRSSHKKNRKSKQKRRKSSIRRKLLRITEDDSAFDTSEEHESSDSSGSSSSDDSDTTFEIEKNERKHKDDKEHGHKKIVIINKKPKPPLPSFIFLPNMDTPFYPPIGLPPPPIMPMYPLVPVPPMPAFPCPELDQEANGSTTLTTTVTTVPSTISIAIEKTTNTPELPAIEETSPPITTADATTQQAKSGRSGYYRKRKRPSRTKQNSFGSGPYMNINNRKPINDQKNQPINRQKLLQKLHQRINNPEIFRPPYDTMKLNEDEMIETPPLENNIYEETMNNEIQSNPNAYAHSKTDNVDFKYISELIHHIDPNKSRDLPPIEYNSNESVEIYKAPKPNKIRKSEMIPPIETRRSTSDDAYYTNLGRQIASIIRNVDSQNQQIDIEIQQSEQNNDNHVFFKDNSHRSFWERSVRSPLKYLNANQNKYDYLKKSNELLFNIENKVSIVASTAPTLSLQEIENIVNIMEKAQSKIKEKKIILKEHRVSNDNLNFNLWPSDSLIHENANKAKMIPLIKPSLRQSNVANNNNFKNSPELKGLSMQNIQRVRISKAWITAKRDNHTYDKNLNSYPKPLIDPKPSNTQQASPEPAVYIPPANFKLPKSIPPHNYFRSNRYRGINKYFQDRHLTPEDDGLHLPRKTLGQLINKQIDQQPSYFHHEINHFDYFN